MNAQAPTVTTRTMKPAYCIPLRYEALGIGDRVIVQHEHAGELTGTIEEFEVDADLFKVRFDNRTWGWDYYFLDDLTPLPVVSHRSLMPVPLERLHENAVNLAAACADEFGVDSPEARERWALADALARLLVADGVTK